MSLGCINARSVGNKAATLCRTIVDEQLDVLVITETWHERSDSTELRRVTPANYKCIDAARPIPPDAKVDTLTFHNYGGLAFIYRQSLKLQKRQVDTAVTTFEFLCGFASTGSCHFILLGVYRPGSQALSAIFFDDLSAVFDQLATYQCPVVVCGDFNIHVDVHDDVHALRLTQLLQCYGFVQHVVQPTHKDGHTLDLVITRDETTIRDLHVGGLISDHAPVYFRLCVTQVAPVMQQMTSREWRRLSTDAFASDLAASELCGDLIAYGDQTVDDLVQLYNRVMTALLDKHCPAVTVRRRANKKTSPWFDADCRAARRRARAAERRFKRTTSDTDYRAWSAELSKMRELYEEKNSAFWRSEIATSCGSTQRLWHTFQGLLGEPASDDTGAHTADDFAAFFKDKVDSVRSSTTTTPLYDVPFRLTPTLENWTPVTTDELEKLIGSAPCKTCQLDPVPTWLVKNMKALLSPFIMLLFNKSLAVGCFPSDFKKAVVRPLLKKAGSDISQMKNFRPVSNLSFLSKLLERVVQKRLQEFLDSNNLMPVTQSAYRQYHSTETAVTKVYDDLLLAADKGDVSALCLLDLTAAFDTVDHDLLILRLERQFGLRGVVLRWFSSYLSDRTFQVVYGGCTSSVIIIVCSVPQGSVLGPRLFILYTADLADVAAAHDVNIHSYADDTQLYLQCQREDMTTAIRRLESCTSDVSHWMAANRLKLNADKTELLWAGSKYGSISLVGSGPPLRLGDETITASEHVRLLGVTISSDLSIDKHVSNISSSCFYWLRQIRRIRRSLDTESVKTMVHAFVSSRIDGCNTVLAGSSKASTDRLQRVLNAAARVVSGTRKFDRGLTHLLHSELHWLDVPERIQFKLGVTVHRCLQGNAPRYLVDCCKSTADVASRQRLRSASRHQLIVPRHRRTTFGRRAFSVAGPSAWNSLPDYLRDLSLSEDTFRRLLKTYLFALY